jgi:hypothetical protein|tara:strand:- start:12004 stop:13068 length:1065 start_codon:yes stop_codon:yes gene_type:complete
VLSKTITAQQSDANVGNITELNGNGRVVRDIPYDAALSFGIESFDNVQTSNGRIGITFLDESQVRLTEHSELIIDEFIYDPDPSKSKMSLQFASGTARFITGKLATINKENIFIETPSATVGIRGTDFTITIDELGRSLIILLPTDEGLPSGEIVVSTAMGEVVLNQPYQATSVSTFESKPAKPVILDITTELIDNMLIVSPPKEEIILTEDSTNTQTNNILDVDYLEFEDLDVDYLQDNALEFTELDINYLDVNFLEDLLNIIEEIDELDETESLLRTSINLSGTQVGYDAETQINTFITDQYITFYRSLEHTVKLDLDKAGAYTVILIQNGKSTQIVVNGGGSSVIKITQGS